jgi:hypothetical protein
MIPSCSRHLRNRRPWRRYTDLMRSVDTWDGIAPEGRWATELFDELMETTTQTPEALLARARQLRMEANATEIDGFRTGCLKLAQRYEQTAAARRATR